MKESVKKILMLVLYLLIIAVGLFLSGSILTVHDGVETSQWIGFYLIEKAIAAIR